MLNLETILWVCPGLVFLYFYEKTRPVSLPKAEGWRYVFSLVLLAVPTWLLAEVIVDLCGVHSDYKTISILILSLVFSFVLSLVWPGVLLKNNSLINFFLSNVDDIFLKTCLKNQNEWVIISLRNNKCYIGFLVSHSIDMNVNFNQQDIQLQLLLSGWRSPKDGTVDWNVSYPFYSTNDDENDFACTIFPRREIVTFGSFNLEIAKHFGIIPAAEVDSTTSPSQ